MLGMKFTEVAFLHADKLATEKKLDKNKIAKDLNSAVGEFEFREAYDKYFKEEIKLRLT